MLSPEFASFWGGSTMMVKISLLKMAALAGALVLQSTASDPGLRRVTPSGVQFPVNSPQSDFEMVEAFPGLLFDNPAGVVSAPGDTNRLFVIERKGRISVIPDLGSPSKEIFLDITPRVNSNYEDPTGPGAEGICSIAFHPGWATNRTFFLTYSTTTNGVTANRLSRFLISSGDPNRADPNSEAALITQPDFGYGHNFNELRFGPDGYLYMAAGDEGDGNGPGDEYENSQRIDKNFFSAILRIDVDGRPGSLLPNPHPASHGGYWIPPDNPFVGAASFNGQPVNPNKVRDEFYAVGFRNPWRMSFDRATGALYVADVGRKDREEINVVVKGGNYGWGFREGSDVKGPLGDPPAGVTLVPPILEYGRSDGWCIIGGFVYRGNQFPELHGKYIFGDWLSGHIWTTTFNGQTATPKVKIAGLLQLSAFGENPRTGDILVCWDNMQRMSEEKIFKLKPRTGSSGGALPPTLADAGLFQDLGSLVPKEGFVPFDVNVPLWSDYAEKRRWFGILQQDPSITFRPESNWTFPSGTVWIKHFDIELFRGDPASRRRLETRVLVKNDAGIHGATYRWGDSTSNATLVPDGGMDETFEVRVGRRFIQQTWRYPSRTECLTCHTPSGGYALGFNTAQLNRDFHYSHGTENQITALREAGYLTPAEGPVHTLRKLAPLDDESWSREARARSYLAANCMFCHNPNGVDRARWDGSIETALSQTGLIHGVPADNQGNPANRIVKPGDPEHSLLLTRMISTNSSRMPPIGTLLVDEEAVALIRDWIEQDLAGYQTFDEWAAGFPIKQAGPDDDPDADGSPNWLEYLLGTNPSQPGDAFTIEFRRQNGSAGIRFDQRANVGYEVQAASRPEGPWLPLDVPSNAPFLGATNRTAVVDFLVSPAHNEFFRVRVYEP